MTTQEISAILHEHAKWLRGEGGKCANLSGADLRDANLSDADLRCANLRGANLCSADLRDANLRDADLRCADLCGANLCSADLRDADLRDADLSDADLRDADLSGANLRGANLCSADLRDAKNLNIPLACPDTGSFIGWKKASGLIVKLLIPSDAKRLSATGRKCRCNKAKVLEIQNLDGSMAEVLDVRSGYDPNFHYRLGSVVKVDDFDENRWYECSTGIHFFITREEAVAY